MKPKWCNVWNESIKRWLAEYQGQPTGIEYLKTSLKSYRPAKSEGQPSLVWMLKLSAAPSIMASLFQWRCKVVTCQRECQTIKNGSKNWWRPRPSAGRNEYKWKVVSCAKHKGQPMWMNNVVRRNAWMNKWRPNYRLVYEGGDDRLSKMKKKSQWKITIMRGSTEITIRRPSGRWPRSNTQRRALSTIDSSFKGLESEAT